MRTIGTARMKKKVVVYTDASFSQDLHVAACGYCILLDEEMIKHEVTLYENVLTPTEAERLSIQDGIKSALGIKGVRAIVINTDCKTLSDECKASREKNTKNKELNDTILFINSINIGLTINYIRGHNGHTYNDFIDRSCRHHLRKLVKEKSSPKKES